MIPVQHENRLVYIDQAGAIVLETPFTQGGWFSEGLAPVKMDEAFGFIDTTGQLVLEPQWINIRAFREGCCAVRIREGKWGLIDREGRWLLPPIYREVGDCHCGLVKINASQSGQYLEQIIRATDGAVVVAQVFTTSGRYSEGLLAAQPSILGRYGYLDTEGRWAIEPQYELAYDFSEGLGLVLMNERKGVSAFIDTEGREVLKVCKPVYAHDGFKEGLVVITKDKEGWGAMDREGQEVIPCTFEYLRPFVGGLAGATDRPTSKTGFIDKTGSWVIPPVFDGIFSLGFGDGSRYGVSKVWVEDQGLRSYYHVNREGRLIWPPGGPSLEELAAKVSDPVFRLMDLGEYLSEKAYPKAGKLLAGHMELAKTLKKLLSQCRQDAPSPLWNRLKPAALTTEGAAIIREMTDALSKVESDTVMVWVALDDTPEGATLFGIREWSADPEDWGWTLDGGTTLARSFSTILSESFEVFEFDESDNTGGRGIVSPYDCLTMLYSLVYFGACVLEAFASLPKERSASLGLTISHPDSNYGIILKKAEEVSNTGIDADAAG